MVNLNEIIEGNANSLPTETYQRLLDAVSEVIHDLPNTTLMTPELEEALRSQDLTRGQQIEREQFPAVLMALREITSHDPCLMMACVQMFGLDDIQQKLQAVALGQLLTFECILAYIRKHSESDEIAELNRMFNGSNKPLDNLNHSCDDIDMEDAA